MAEAAPTAEAAPPRGEAETRVLRGELAALRYRLARERGMPANANQSRQDLSLGNIFSEKVLASLAEACPQDLEALGHVPGFGPTKVQHFGEQVLAVCEAHCVNQKRAAEGRTHSPSSKRPRGESAKCVGDARLTPEQRKWADVAARGG